MAANPSPASKDYGSAQGDLFADLLPRPQAWTLMRCIERGAGHTHSGRFKCRRCGGETGWLTFHSSEQAQRPMPCIHCN